MKKTHRTLLSILLVLTLLVSLPLTALAEETVNSADNVKLDKDYDYNTGENVTVPENITVGINQGFITTVEKGGTVDVNVRFIGNSVGPIDEKAGNFGTINKNYEFITVNHNQVGTNASKGYKVVEIKDDAYVVVTFDALPDEDVADLNALYARLFTPEQQKLVKNMGQLLDSEDVLTIFGKPGNHPVFEFQKDLVK